MPVICYVEYVIFDFYILKGLYVIVDGLAAHLLHLRLSKLYNLKMDGLAAHLLFLRLKGFYVMIDGLIAHLLLLRLKGGFALLRPPRGPLEFDCPAGNLINKNGTIGLTTLNP